MACLWSTSVFHKQANTKFHVNKNGQQRPLCLNEHKSLETTTFTGPMDKLGRGLVPRCSSESLRNTLWHYPLRRPAAHHGCKTLLVPHVSHSSCPSQTPAKSLARKVKTGSPLVPTATAATIKKVAWANLTWGRDESRLSFLMTCLSWMYADSSERRKRRARGSVGVK